MNKMLALALFATAIFGYLGKSEAAIVFLKGQVTSMEITYFPTSIIFGLSAGDAKCPIGIGFLWAKSDKDNMKAAQAVLMSSLLSGKPVQIAYESTTNPSSGRCAPSFLYLVKE